MKKNKVAVWAIRIVAILIVLLMVGSVFGVLFYNQF